MVLTKVVSKCSLNKKGFSATPTVVVMLSLIDRISHMRALAKMQDYGSDRTQICEGEVSQQAGLTSKNKVFEVDRERGCCATSR